jgi:hypothetical protein
MKKLLLGMMLIGSINYASANTVNGVYWNPTDGSDLTIDGGLFETIAGHVGDHIVGYGEVNKFNGRYQNEFCPGCELTYTFSYQMLSSSSNAVTYDGSNTYFKTFEQVWNGTSIDYINNSFLIGSGDKRSFFPTINPLEYTFTFGDGIVEFFADSTPDFTENAPTLASASDGISFLKLKSNGLLRGTGYDIFNPGAIYGSGSGFLDAVSGSAFEFFNTNSMNGADLQFTSSFHINNSARESDYLLGGTVHVTGDTVDVPEPSSILIFLSGILGVFYFVSNTRNMVA